MKNLDVRNYATKKGVKLWEIAEKLNIHDSNLSRLLRKEVSKQKKSEIINAVDEIVKEKIGDLTNE